MALNNLAPNYNSMTPQALVLGKTFDSTGTSYANVANLAGNNPAVQPTFTNTLDTTVPIKPPVAPQAKFIATHVVVTNVSAGALAAGCTFSMGWTTTATGTPSGLFISASTALQSLAAGASYCYTLANAAATNWTSSPTNQYLNAAFPVAGGASTAVKIDVLGYFQPIGA